MRRADPRHLLVFALLAAAAGAAVIAAVGKSPTAQSLPPVSPSAWQGLVGSRPAVAGDDRVIVVLRTPSLAQRVAAAGGSADIERERAWTNIALSAQRLLLSRLALHGVVVHPDYTFARVIDGFSATIPASALPLVLHDPDVGGIYPVRVAYPATIASVSTDGPPAAGLSLSGLDGRGVTVAVVDTGIDPKVGSLLGHVMPGVDLVGGDPGALASLAPGDPSRREQHGTEMAGIVLGVAPGAAILPIRAAGWQPDAHGRWAIYARTDQIVAGLDRAVDPNDDGDAHDGARIALVALAEPFAAFADSAESLAVAGARKLDMLVVVPGGNDGATGAAFGDISGPGGAPAALTVGALDAGGRIAETRLVLRSGLQTLYAGTAPALGGTLPGGELRLEVAAGSPFTRAGVARLAGRAALVPGGASPASAAGGAAAAGAAAVLLYGGTLPAGGLGDSFDAPVISVPPPVARAVADRLAHAQVVTVALGRAGSIARPDVGHVASFSSSGLAFDGSVKPDLVAPGVGLPTVDPGGAAVSIAGSSGSAATVAGAAALLAQARPSLGADALASVLVGSANELDGDPVAAQGAGAVDVGAAAAAEVAASPPTLAFGESTGPGWSVHAPFTLTNLSTRPLRVSLGIETQAEGAATVDFSLRPSQLVIEPGGTSLVRVGAITSSPAVGTEPAGGAVIVRVSGGGSIRVPWVIVFTPKPQSLLRGVSFRGSGLHGGVLVVDAGTVGAGIRPLKRLDVILKRTNGRWIGLLARLRDVLPGRYRFELTGNGPDGQLLPPGLYSVAVLGYPFDGGSPSSESVRFTVR